MDPGGGDGVGGVGATARQGGGDGRRRSCELALRLGRRIRALLGKVEVQGPVHAELVPYHL